MLAQGSFLAPNITLATCCVRQLWEQRSLPAFPMAANNGLAMPVTYHRIALQTKESGDMLRLPFRAIATALVFLHRFKQASLAAYADNVSNWLLRNQ